jgi:hypothetical protein
MKTVLYCRVSTLDQTLEHQRVQAEQAGFKPDLVLADHGISSICPITSNQRESVQYCSLRLLGFRDNLHCAWGCGAPYWYAWASSMKLAPVAAHKTETYRDLRFV